MPLTLSPTSATSTAGIYSVDYDYLNASWEGNDTNAAQQPFGDHDVWEAILIIIISATIAIFTVCANVMVWLSFYMEKQLQVVNNYFILSLATADIIIGAMSIPFYTLYLLQGGWRLGNIFCDIWLSIDYVASNASVMNLCIICFDRFLSVTRPLTYRANRTPRKAKMMISFAWIISVVVWVPLIVGWQFFVGGGRNVLENDCYIQFLSDEVSLNVVTIMIAFYVPVGLMGTLYYKIWRETEKRSLELEKLQEGGGHSSAPARRLLSNEDTDDEVVVRVKNQSRCLRCPCCMIADLGEEDDDSSDITVHHNSPSTMSYSTSLKSRRGSRAQQVLPPDSPRRNLPRDSPKGSTQMNGNLAVPEEEISHENNKSFAASLYTILIKLPDESANASDEDKLARITMVEESPQKEQSMIQDQEGTHLMPPETVGNEKSRSNSVVSNNKAPINNQFSISTISMVNKMASRAKTNVNRKRKSQLIREKKAARTLCAILLAFIITWTPYSVLVLVSFSGVQNDAIQRSFEVAYWLCYLNSTLNPVCYALCNATFRRAFKRILTCQWTPRHRRMQKQRLHAKRRER